jgi:hypothetical protein
MRKLNILYLSNRPSGQSQAATVTEYLDAMKEFSTHNVFEVSMLGRFPEKIQLDKFDVVMTHYSLSLGPLINHYLGRNFIESLREFRGLKVAFLQDEYRAIKTYWENLNYLKIDLLFSCVPEDEIQKVYPSHEVPNLHVENVLTGYVPKKFVSASVPPIKDRSIDVSYRTRRMPFWLGELGKEKWHIAEEFIRRGKTLDLTLDLSVDETDRKYGLDWENFLKNSKCVLGVESGASIIDFDGKLESIVDMYVDENPNASFDEVHSLFLKEFEGSLKLNQISPRCFEAAALRTVMILFEGEYSGVLQPNRHYIPLKKDFSNFNEVISKVKDTEFLQNIANITYNEIACNPNYSYRKFISYLDETIERQFVKRGKVEKISSYGSNEFEDDLKKSWAYRLTRSVAMLGQQYFLGNHRSRKLIFWLWGMLPLKMKNWSRPIAKLVSK